MRPLGIQRRQGAGGRFFRVEDSNPAIVYDGQWSSGNVTIGDDNDASIHTSTQPGSTIKFTFHGTFVGVFGVLDGQPVSATLALDDRPTQPLGVSSPPPNPQANYPFFSTSPPLEPGEHVLTITVQSGKFNLDYIQFTAVDGFENLGPSADSTISGSPTRSPSSPGLSESSAVFSNKPLSTGAVAGISIAGGLILVGIAAMMFCVFYRRARRVRHRRLSPKEKPLDIIYDDSPAPPPPAARGPLRRFSRMYRPTPSRSTRSKTTTTSSVTQSSAMFTSVIMLSPALSMVSEEASGHHAV
ncbi:hypothetical protein C8Q76DRAFT_423353 [Earliella scabrosa]|nr:hypothetical protein C8Q76DRAFT_423353 [Earliella scabrosa]